jgi:outer membrane protein assembly factor BamB
LIDRLRDARRTVGSLRLCWAAILPLILALSGCHVGAKKPSSLSSSGSSSSGSVLPTGVLSAAWEVDLHGSFPYGYDRVTRTIEVNSVELNGPSLVGALDAASGQWRWKSASLGSSWATEEVEPRSPVVTSSGIGFVSQQASYRTDDPAPLTAVRLSDGQPLWQSPAMTGIKIVGNILVGYSGPAVDAVDPRTGARRWQWALPSDCASPLILPTVQNSVIVRCDASFVSLRPSDGQAAWSWKPDGECVMQDSVANDYELAVVATCGSVARLILLDPATGAKLGDYQAPWAPGEAAPDDPSRGAPVPQLAEGTVILDSAHTVTVLTRTGSVLQTVHEARCETWPCGLAVGRRIVIGLHLGAAYAPTEGSTQLEALDATNGRLLWQRPLVADTLVFDRGLLYATGALPDPLWSSTITVLRPDNGDFHQVATLHATAQIVDVSAGHIFLKYDTPSSADPGFTTGEFRFDGTSKGLLGGAAAEQWPDACQLLTADQLQALDSKVKYVSVGRSVAVAGQQLPHAPLCTFSPSEVRRPVITIAVVWVTADVNQAARIASDYAGHSTQLPGLGVAAYKMNQGQDEKGRPNVATVLAAGRCVVEIGSPGDGKMSVAVAPLVVKKLATAATAAACRP